MLQIRFCHKLKSGRIGSYRPIYPIIFIDAIHFSVRDDSVIRKLATYVVLGINLEGKK